MLAGSVLETLGVGLVIPVLIFMSQSDPMARFPWLAEMLGPISITQLLAGATLVLVGTYALKAVYLAFVTWKQARFVFGVQVSLSRQLFDGYLRQPYTFHLQRNSAEMIRNVVTETSQFSHVATIPGLTLLSEGFVLAAISALLLVLEPVGALTVVLTIGVAGFAYYRITRARVLRWGIDRQYHEGMRIQHLQQGLGGVKEVKLLGRELEFLERYAVHDLGVAYVQERQLTLQGLPRIWMELLGVTGLCALVLTLMSQGKPAASLVPTLGLFAAAAFRLIPSLSKVVTAVQSLRYAKPVIDTLTNELREMDRRGTVGRTGSLSICRSLALRNVSFRYPDASSNALENINLEIPHGSSIGFIGGSGAGKSTLVDIVLGLLTPTRGAVLVDGNDIGSNLRDWQDQIGYVPQSIFLTDDSLRSNVAFGVAPADMDEQAVLRALRLAQLEEFTNELPDGLNTVVGERGVRLSGGQRQRIGIARALYHDPAVLVLDEATSALDTATERGVMEAVKALQGKKTILLVAHRLSTVEHCDMIVRLEQGVVAGMGNVATMLSAPASQAPTATVTT